jgi:hypothetical protein
MVTLEFDKMEAQRCCDAFCPSVWAAENTAQVGTNLLKLRPYKTTPVYNPSAPDCAAKNSILQAVSGLDTQ